MGVSYEQVVKEGEVKRKERKETKEKHLEDIRELFTYKPMLEIMQW